MILSIVLVDPTMVYVGLIVAAGAVIIIFLIVKSSDEYSVEETEINADEFAGTIKESQGSITSWLWVVYIALTIWAIAYLIQHGAEFATFP